MKFQCGHCSHVFILNNEDLRRCPKCFWTTSLEPILDSGPEAKGPEKDKQVVSAKREQRVQTRMPPSLWKGVLFLLAAVILAGGIFMLLKSHSAEKASSVPLLSLSTPLAKKEIAKIPSLPKPGSVSNPVSLTDEEKKELLTPFKISIPRILSNEETEILKKRVPSPADLSEMPKLTFWSLEDFKTMLNSAQDQRKIPLGWFYVRAVTKVFENGYLKAAQFYEQRDYVQARNALFRGLAFPVYQGNQLSHRSVALVMLRPYINDVVGKLSVVQNYFFNQQSGDELRNIYKSYQDLLGVLDLRDWGKAESLITDLSSRISQFNSSDQPASALQYPPVFAQIDQEIQNVIMRDAGKPSLPAGATNFTAMKADLEAKAKVARENKEESLIAVQKRHEQAVDDIRQENWMGAYDQLKEISYPEELVEQVRKKMDILGKILSDKENRL